MRITLMKKFLGLAGLAMAALLGSQAAQATTVSITARPASLTLPDGSVAPMWSYCGGLDASAPGAGAVSGGACAAAAAGALPAWTQGPTIIVPAGDALTINLSNQLPVPTSLTIVGQVGGGLGQPSYARSPAHPGVSATTFPGNGDAVFTPPAQPDRARSFVPEANGQGGTYSYSWPRLKPGTYLYHSGSRPSLQVPMGLYGVLVVTSPAGSTSLGLGQPGSAYAASGANGASYPLAYDADALFLFSEVDLVQNSAVAAAAAAMAAAATPAAGNDAFSALEQRADTSPGANPPIIGNPTTAAPATPCSQVACYPPAVNYAPTYFLVNGQSYDQANPAASAAIVPDTVPGGVTATHRVLARLVNAGLKTHIPTFVGLDSLLVAEDGNLQPDVALGMLRSAGALVGGKVQSAVLLPAGKTMDVALNPALAGTPAKFADTAWPLLDRELSLTAGNRGAGGLQAFLATAPPGTTQATLASVLGTAGSSALPQAVAVAANADTFQVPAGSTSFSGNVLANDIGLRNASINTAISSGTVLLGVDGSFTVSGPAGGVIPDGTQFSYQALDLAGTAYTATVTLRVSSGSTDAITFAAPATFTSQVATLIRVPHPGLLATASSALGYRLVASAGPALPGQLPAAGETFVNTRPTCQRTDANPGVCSVKVYPDGAFIMSATQPGDYTFTWYAVNPQGQSAASTATVTFPKGSGARVLVTDSVTGKAATTGYRWVLEEDQTFLHDPGNAGFVPPSFPTPVSLAYTPVTLAGSLVSPQVTATTGTLPANFPGFVAGSYVQIAGSATDAFNGTFRINTLTSTGFTFTLWQVPAAGATAAATGTAFNSQSLATNFHRSYMPVVAAGCTGTATVGVTSPKSCNDLGVPVSPADVLLDPTKRYFLSVLPDDAGNPAAGIDDTGHTMGAANIAGAQITAPAANPVNVLVPLNPLPPAQLSAIVFEDSNPVSGDVDEGEAGLGGFQIEVFDVRGSSGDGVGQITYDVFNQPLTNALANTPGTGTDGLKYPNLCPTTPNGVPQPVGVVYTCMPVPDANGNDISPFTGMALIRNMEPGRLDVQAHPAAWREGKGEQWIQVSTLEGTPNNDTFVHPGEPAYWQEFGPPGFHSFIGFLNPAHVAKVNADTAALAAAAGQPLVTLAGRITNLHMDRPPEGKLNNSCQPGNTDAGCARAALNYTTCYVGLNAQAGDGATISFAQCDADGKYSLANVPPGTYALFIWDEWLDQIKAKQAITVPASVANGERVTVADIPVFNWFTRLQETIYLDLNANGVRDPGEPGLANLPLNVRFRDGSFSNRIATDLNGDGFFNEVFPLFNWYVVESDQTRYKNTGVHVIYDAGGIPDQVPLASTLAPNGEYFSTAGVLNSAEKFPVPQANRIPGAKYLDGSTERIDPGAYVFEGFQGFINQTEFVEFGKLPYAPGENGGIAGMIYYASVRAFDDPRLKVQNLWEPGIPRVQVNLYRRTTNADGTFNDTLVDTTTSNSWDDWANGTGAFGTPGVPNLSCPGNPPAVPPSQLPGYTAGVNDPFVNYSLGVDPATGITNQFKCYDGQHAFNQVQPAVYDGFYAFPTAGCQACTTAHWTNPDGTPADTPILNPGTYVVEVVPPDGFEMTKEEDKNILIGDAWIAAAPQQFGSPVNIFILPDQATLNDRNPEGFPLVNPPCVGTPHLVPEFLSLVPDAQQAAPYAGQVRNLCDRKLVVQQDQMAMTADFQLWTPTPIAGHVSGLMLNDAAAEFDPYSPSFGEKFALPNAPVSIRDYNGTEILRAYTDKWGTFDFLNVSTWDANVPNPSGYAPNMLTYCMNDPGPVPTGAAGQYQVDPYYNPQYSDFCYNWPILPGITTYLDTPVLPVSAFASHYAPVDCQYADATPAIRRVDGNYLPAANHRFPSTAAPAGTGVGPFMNQANGTSRTLVITALGDVSVLNPAYAGPNAAPGTTYAANRITRHYGFGGTAGTVQLVRTNTNGSLTTTTLTPTAWNDGEIRATVPATLAAADYQLVVKTATGVATVDSVTVTLANLSATGARAPWYVAAPPPGTGLGAGQGYGLPHPIQDAIDSPLVQPGDVVLVDEGMYPELVVMWKPVKLQGVGAAATTIQATKYPNSKVADWRNRINLLFGLDPQGNQLASANGTVVPAQVDPLPGQEITGGIVRLEPSALSTEEGAGITVLAANLPSSSCALGTSAPTPFRNLVPATPQGFYPTLAPMGVAGSPPATATTGAPARPVQSALVATANAGTLPAGTWYYVVTALNANGESLASNERQVVVAVAGSAVKVTWTAVPGATGYNVYRGKAAGAEAQWFSAGNVTTWTDGIVNMPVNVTSNQRNWSNFSCATARIDGIGVTGSDAGGGIYVNGWAHGLQVSNNRVFGNSGPYAGGVRIGQPYLEGQGATPLGYNRNVKILHNAILNNGTDEANAAPGSPVGTSGAGGGLAIEAGSDNFAVQNNWICGNFSAGDGGGVGILGNSSGNLTSNTIIFNESYQQTGPSHGGGIAIEGEPGTGTTPGSGVGTIVVDGNLIQGNAVRSGSGGGIRLAGVNGVELQTNPGSPFKVSITNNVIANNVAGWAGGGVSMVDSAYVTLWGNTIVNNDSVGTAGNLMNTLVNGVSTGPATSVPNAAGVAVEQYTAPVRAALAPLTGNRAPRSKLVSQPTVMENNVIWHNRAFFFDSTSGKAQVCASNNWNDAGSHQCNQLPVQASTGQCVDGAAYWDVGVVGDTSAVPAAAAPKLVFDYSVLSSTAGYSGAAYAGNQANDPRFVKGYCNGSRVQPGSQFEPGSPFQPPFQLAAAASLDESGNFVDFQFGPLSLVDPVTPANGANGDYHLQPASPAADAGLNPSTTVTALTGNTGHDFDGGNRPVGSGYDIGADEIGNVVARSATLFNPNRQAASYAYGSQQTGTTTTATFTYTNTSVSGGVIVVSGTSLGGTHANQFSVVATGTTCLAGTLLLQNASCSVVLGFTPTSAGNKTAQLTVSSSTGGVTPTNDPVTVTGTGVAPTPRATLTAPGGQLTSAASPYAFGNQPVGVATAPATFTYSNTGTLPITVSGAAIGGTNASNFAVVAGTGTTCVNGLVVQPGSGCLVAVRFTPSALLVRSATLTVNTSTAGVANTGNPAYLTGNGTGGVPVVQPLNSQLLPLALTTTPANTTVKTGSFTITNLGTGAMGVGSMSFNSTLWTVTGTDCGASLAPQAACTVDVRYAPTGTTTVNATLTVNLSSAFNLLGTSINSISVYVRGN